MVWRVGLGSPIAIYGLRLRLWVGGWVRYERSEMEEEGGSVFGVSEWFYGLFGENHLVRLLDKL